MFNWLTVCVLLPVELASGKITSSLLVWSEISSSFHVGMLFRLTDAITKSIAFKKNSNTNPEFLTVITKPLTERIIQVCSFRTKRIEMHRIHRCRISSLIAKPFQTLLWALPHLMSHYWNASVHSRRSMVPTEHWSVYLINTVHLYSRKSLGQIGVWVSFCSSCPFSVSVSVWSFWWNFCNLYWKVRWEISSSKWSTPIFRASLPILLRI